MEDKEMNEEGRDKRKGVKCKGKIRKWMRKEGIDKEINVKGRDRRKGIENEGEDKALNGKIRDKRKRDRKQRGR